MRRRRYRKPTDPVSDPARARRVLILSADDLIFELPVGFSQRLHARLDQEMTS